MKKLFEIGESEKKRILEMHENATKKNYLNEAQSKCSVELPKSMAQVTGADKKVTNAGGVATICSIFDNNSEWAIAGIYFVGTYVPDEESQGSANKVAIFYSVSPVGTLTSEFSINQNVNGSYVFQGASEQPNYLPANQDDLRNAALNKEGKAIDTLQNMEEQFKGVRTIRGKTLVPNKEMLANYYISRLSKGQGFDQKSGYSTNGLFGVMINSIKNQKNNIGNYPNLKTISDAVAQMGPTAQTTPPSTK